LFVHTSGEIFRPFIIFQRETVPKVLLDLVINKKCYIGGQESGWISAKGFLGYMNAIINDINCHRKNFDLSKTASERVDYIHLMWMNH